MPRETKNTKRKRKWRTDSLECRIRKLYANFGQQKPMGSLNIQDTRTPFFFLHRTFLGEQDLLIIFKTKRCRYNCNFCSLSTLSSSSWVSESEILSQFEYVIVELKHSLSVLDRITISNNGSVLDGKTMSPATLVKIAKCIKEIRRIHTMVLESRLEFFDNLIMEKIRAVNPRLSINILAGFETLNTFIRDDILDKKESIKTFEKGLDKVAESGVDLTAFVLYKPSHLMSDSDAYLEAEDSIEYLVKNCNERGIDLTIRLNPMFAAKGSKWAKIAFETPGYQPPRLSDVLELAQAKLREGIPVYIGLSTENLDLDKGSYKCREDYSEKLLNRAILFNNNKLSKLRF